MMKNILCFLLMLATLLCFVSCGENKNEPFVYAQNTDGTLTVTAYKVQNKATVTIPDSYLDRKVTAIGAMAFEGTVMMTSVVIPDSITSIGSSAFANCQRLTAIDLPDSLETIEDWAFQNCMGLSSVVIPEGVTEIGDYAFKGCAGLTSVTISGNVKAVGSGAFSELTALQSYTGPLKHLQDMPKHTLTSVTLVAGAYDKIEFVTFYDCSSLTEITYTGTMAEWLALDKADGWLTSLPEKTLTVHCADGDLVEKT